jgi:hypothetical protein
MDQLWSVLVDVMVLPVMLHISQNAPEPGGGVNVATSSFRASTGSQRKMYAFIPEGPQEVLPVLFSSSQT